ncbi:hypothetical protein BDZ97DRAFT_1759455 [Flammula alnicola]|nr:hypothetical protein BDZ97DRAFT_1759455 [Flammula alnicola]
MSKAACTAAMPTIAAGFEVIVLLKVSCLQFEVLKLRAPTHKPRGIHVIAIDSQHKQSPLERRTMANNDHISIHGQGGGRVGCWWWWIAASARRVGGELYDLDLFGATEQTYQPRMCADDDSVKGNAVEGAMGNGSSLMNPMLPAWENTSCPREGMRNEVDVWCNGGGACSMSVGPSPVIVLVTGAAVMVVWLLERGSWWGLVTECPWSMVGGSANVRGDNTIEGRLHADAADARVVDVGASGIEVGGGGVASSTTMLVGVGSVDARDPLEYDSAGSNDEPPPLEPALLQPAKPELALTLALEGPAVCEENIEVIGGVSMDSCFATLIALTALAPAFEEDADELADRRRSAAPRIDGLGVLDADDITVMSPMHLGCGAVIVDAPAEETASG